MASRDSDCSDICLKSMAKSVGCGGPSSPFTRSNCVWVYA